MKILDIMESHPSVEDILQSARKESVFLKTINGEMFFLTLVDDFTAEVELLRKNHAFLTFLDECKKDVSAISLEEVEQIFR